MGFSVKGSVLITGATGFVGMEVLARYLERSDRHLYALVRASDDRHQHAECCEPPAHSVLLVKTD